MFPLPDFVLFPRAIVPLHVFELRYRTMVRDALSRDRIIALTSLRPGFEAEYYGSPEFHPLGCLAHFEEVRKIVREFPYRSALVDPLPQHPYAEDDPIVQLEKLALLEQFAELRRVMAERVPEDALAGWPELGPEDVYERVVNTLCICCGGTCAERLALLEEDSVLERGRRVRAQLLRALTARPKAEGEEGGERN